MFYAFKLNLDRPRKPQYDTTHNHYREVPTYFLPMKVYLLRNIYFNNVKRRRVYFKFTLNNFIKDCLKFILFVNTVHVPSITVLFSF